MKRAASFPKTPPYLLLAYAIALGAFASSIPLEAAEAFTPKCIVVASDASANEQLAAREIRRYAYLRTGALLPLARRSDGRSAIVVGHPKSAWLQELVSEASLRAPLSALKPQEYWLKTVTVSKKPVLLVTGGDDVAVLYAAYRLAEHLGVRFYLHGDVLPDAPVKLELPALDEKVAPLFALRGIQPFHDFPEGPDWWNRDDYLAILSQLPKLRMNFFGLHTYPEGGPNAEPTVWIGQKSDVGENGRVKFSYPSSYQSTLRGNWGYAPKKTGDYALGASQLFERDDFGAEVMWGYLPQPTTPDGCNAVFDRTAEMLRAAFIHARQLGVKTCVGTETALTVPQVLRERLKAQGKDPGDPATIKALYTGIFRRIEQAYPIDYYWFWTPEGWTWEGTKDEQVKRTLDDLLAGVAAATNLDTPFELATCGWVLGPQQDRAMFDKVLPKKVAVSCINREVGKTSVDKGFADVAGRGKWAIPWLEDDPALTSPQLWVGRMRRDAADARRYGCDGLMGIHWRTRVLGPAVSSLAQAAWTQDAWNPSPNTALPTARVEGPEGGSFADFPDQAIADTELDRVYQTVRYNVTAYRLKVPNGAYTVTLQFCEPHYAAAGRRVFQVLVQGQRKEERLDIFERVGQNRAFDLTYKDVAVRDGWLNVEFVPIIEFPSIAGMVVEGPGFTRKIDCGGAGAGGFAADWPASAAVQSYPATADFYGDWAQHQFGPEVGAQAAVLFEKIDGRLPRPSDWVDGPGGIRPDPRPWEQVAKDYAFVDELAALQSRVQGAGNRERFDWWLHTFRYLRGMGEVNCLWAQYTNAISQAKAVSDTARRKQLARDTALPLRRQLVAAVAELYQHLLATVSNPGELGTVMNWESHNFPGLLTQPGEELAKLLGEPLPPEARLPTGYRGPLRVIVPTVRTSVNPGEALELKVLILASDKPRDAAVHWRTLGKGGFTKVPLAPVARGVYSTKLGAPNANQEALEYYVEVEPREGKAVRFPAAAPRLNQTVVVMP
jgi:hypothetical protein